MGCPALDSEYYDFIVRSEFHFLPIYFDKPVHQSNISAGKILLEREKPSAALFTPQSLAFQFNLNSYLVNVKTSSLPAGVSREVQIYRPNGQGVKYQFKTGDSLATPIEKDVAFDSKVRMIDAYGNPVTDNPAYYERIFPNGSKVRFPAGQTGVPPVINGNKGEDIAADSPDVMVEPIYRDNSIRQIWSAADGLADFVIIDDYKYEIRLYAPENAGSKNTQGLYEPNGNPFELWTVENPNMSDTNFNSARITQTVNGTAYVYDWAYTEGTNAWTVTSGAGLRKSAKFYFGDYTTGNCQIVEEVRNVSNSLVSKKVSNTQKLAWGPAVVSEVVDPDGANLVTTYTYYTVSTETGKYGKVKTVQKPDGSWESYDYDSQGRKTLTVSSYLDAAFNSAAGSAKAEYYSYTSLDSADVLQTNDGRPRTIETKILGNTVSKKYFVYKTVNGEVVEIEEEGIAAFGNSANQRKTTVYYANSANDASKTRVKSISWPDGKLDSYTYEYGTYSANQDPASCSFSAGSGDALRQTIVHGTVANSGGIAGKTTKETSVTDGRSNEAMTETYAYDGSGYSRIAWNVRTFDSEHHVLASYNSNGTYSTATWNCCSKDSETTADGTQYTFSYNLLKQMISKTKCSAGNLPAITNSYTYDAEGHQLSETISGGSALVATSSSYDLAGRATSRTDVAGLTTTYAYSNGGRTVTVTHPGGFTEITDKYLDGKIKSVTGTAIVAKYYTYGVNTDGTQWTKICNVALNGANYVKTTVDALGRTISEEKPGYTGTLVSNYFYNNQGLLIKTTSTGKPDTLYAYDDFNNRTMSCLDLNANGTIDTASVDRVSESEVSYQYESGQWWSVDTSKVYNDSGDAVTTGITKKQLTGLASGTIAVTVSTDINGNDTISTTTLDRTNKTVTQTVNVPDSTADEVSVTVNGLLSAMSTKSSLSYSYSYDGLGRKIGDTDPRTGTSVTHYNSYGHVDYVEDAAGKRTSFTYESSTGRRASVINALNKATANTYNSRGQILTVRGDTTYPLDYVYDSYGRMTQLKTYRNSNLTNPDITIWTYQDSTGFLLSKTYADNKSVSYTYSVEGKLATRTWARTSGGNPLTTTYSYNLAGDMTDIDYSDSTPDIAFTYNRLGQQLTVTDAVGSRTFSYNGVFQLTGEAITGIYNKTINRSYDILGRSSGMNISTEYDVDYGYDTLGRFSTLTNDPNGTNETFTYSYLANSNLISGITYPNDISVTKSYEVYRDLITSVENKYDTTTISKYDYSNDDLGGRMAMGKSGTAFSQTDTISYGYNDKSEVTSAVATNQSTYDYGFTFDPIGNRATSSSTESGTSVTRNYTANQLNQYTAIDNPTSAPTYDFDGNTTSCELSTTNWSFTWDAENRLIAAEKTGQRLEFKYDYMSRRVEKKVIEGETTTKNERFVYDGYFQIEQLDVLDSNAIEKKRIWGDEGKIISDIDSSDTVFYALGDANNNITEYLDASGTIQGHYEFSPFGKITVASGNNPDDFEFRFSSEYLDSETGLVYYNFRYYNSETGRWLSLDPIEKNGGINLYAMCINNILNRIDILGLISTMDNGGGGCCADPLKDCLEKAAKQYQENLKLIDSLKKDMLQLGDRPWVLDPRLNPFNPSPHPEWGVLINMIRYGRRGEGCPQIYVDLLNTYINGLIDIAKHGRDKEKKRCHDAYDAK